MRTRVYVTQKHINNGKIYDSRECALALALKDIFLLNPHISVGAKEWSDGIISYPLSRSAYRFRVHFDSGLFVKPFNFFV